MSILYLIGLHKFKYKQQQQIPQMQYNHKVKQIITLPKQLGKTAIHTYK